MNSSDSFSTKIIPARERLIVALDVPTPDEARRLVETLGEGCHFYKIGLQLFMTGEAFGLIDWLKERGKRVFVDLKFFDVPETVRSAVAQLRERGIDWTTVHGNDAILRAAVEAKGDVGILAVTALTSLDQGDLQDLGFQCDPEALVLSRARRAWEVGCDGVIASGLEVARLRSLLGERLLVVTPGIRPVENRAETDQKRVITARAALEGGADYVVVGRPIRAAADPRAAAEGIQREIASVCGGDRTDQA